MSDLAQSQNEVIEKASKAFQSMRSKITAGVNSVLQESKFQPKKFNAAEKAQFLGELVFFILFVFPFQVNVNIIFFLKQNSKKTC